jgi:hypothetical protein
VNAADQDAEVELGLFAADGTFLESLTMRLEPWSNDQINRIFEDHRPIRGYVEVDRDWRIWCFGSMLDNETSDPTTILPM